MKDLYDKLAQSHARQVTHTYSTSFSLAVRMLAPSIRQDIHNIYGFVRLADEIVDSFHGYDQRRMLEELEQDTHRALERGISTNPIIHAFADCVRKNNIEHDHIDAFLSSMRADLDTQDYQHKEDIDRYIYGSADVVGLMCLHVFVGGDQAMYEKLKAPAMRLGSAFQKVNFLRDIRQDTQHLQRSYFPNVDFHTISPEQKAEIVAEIRSDFEEAYQGLRKLPISSRGGVYLAYRYYRKLLRKLEGTAAAELMEKRVRVSNLSKALVYVESNVRLKFQLL